MEPTYYPPPPAHSDEADALTIANTLKPWERRWFLEDDRAIMAMASKRLGAAVACQAHNLEVGGANPPGATIMVPDDGDPGATLTGALDVRLLRLPKDPRPSPE